MENALERKQFTFYRSYWEALQTLPKKERLEAYDAIADYALNGTERDLSGVAKMAFAFAKPTLENGRRQAKKRIEKMEEETVGEA